MFEVNKPQQPPMPSTSRRRRNSNLKPSGRIGKRRKTGASTASRSAGGGYKRPARAGKQIGKRRKARPYANATGSGRRRLVPTGTRNWYRVTDVSKGGGNDTTAFAQKHTDGTWTLHANRDGGADRRAGRSQQAHEQRRKKKKKSTSRRR